MAADIAIAGTDDYKMGKILAAGSEQGEAEKTAGVVGVPDQYESPVPRLSVCMFPGIWDLGTARSPCY